MTYDVVIAGAGPAGSASAIVLSAARLKVCLVDELKQDAFKVGESLPAAAIRLLRKLGIKGVDDLLSPEQYIPCSANVSAWGNEQWVYADAIQNPEGNGWHLNRLAFDAALRERATKGGVDLIAAKVNTINTNSTDSSCKYTLALKASMGVPDQQIHTNQLIDATGRHFFIGKKFQAKRKAFDKQMAVVCWIDCTADDKDTTTKIKSTENGWWYSSRLPGQKRVIAFHSIGPVIAQLLKDPALFFESCNAAKLLAQRVELSQMPAPLIATPANVSKAERVCGEGWLSVGDATLSFDPLSSQGIFFALYSGIRGAEIILDSIKHPENTMILHGNYTTLVNKVFAANKASRAYYYASERRFTNSEYWQHMQQQSTAKLLL